MIKVEQLQVFNLEGAVRGMRNPMNSWDKSDSMWIKMFDEGLLDDWEYMIGENDLDLMRRLFRAGPEHRKYMRQIFISMDITAPLYWWKEFDTYKVGTTANSCSTMHKIHENQFKLDDFSHDYLGTLNDVCQKLIAKDMWAKTIDTLNYFRALYNNTKDKRYWRMMIEMLPSSYNQKRTVTITMENFCNIYFQRKDHKLDEWKKFCSILIDNLPLFHNIVEEDTYDGRNIQEGK